MNTKRMKRWNGDITKLSETYLNSVIEKMLAYGDSVQFSTSGSTDGPNFQVINASGKKIAFDSDYLLTQTRDDEFIGKNSATVYSLDQVKAQVTTLTSPVVKAVPKKTRRVTSGSTRGGSALSKAKEQIAIQKYEYYKTNRAALPTDIRDHSEEITRMMESGMTAETAFNEAIKLCYVH